MTEIMHVNDKAYFVDNQRCGPFAVWHHLHQFKAIDGGVEMTDLVNYKLPLGPLGNIAHALIVKKRVEAIFNYRYIALQQKFGKL
jgi:ligand-binding SRPBCC domain-containing protein